MAKTPVNSDVANDIIGDNLDMNMDDLGGNPGEDTFTSENDITEDDMPDTGQRQRQDDTGIDDGDVTHTRNRDQQERREERPDVRQQRQNTQERDQQRQERQQRPIPRRAEVQPDARGNLVDREGRVVATAGREARYYQEAARLTRIHEQQRHANAEVTSRLNRALELGNQILNENEQFKAQEKQYADLNLQPQERLQALSLASRAKTEPLVVIKELLTMATMRGIDLGQLGVPDGAKFDPASIVKLVQAEIQNGMRPVRDLTTRQTNAETQRTQAEQAQNQTNRETESFFNENIEARPYMPLFQQLYGYPEFQNYSLREMWLTIQKNLAERRASGQSNTLPNARERRNLPNSRFGQSPPQRRDDVDDHGMMPASSSIEDIVRSALNAS